MHGDEWLSETYFDWLLSDCFITKKSRKEYEGVLRLLHDVPFYWTIWSDENRAGDALSFRQSDFLGFQTGLDNIDQVWLGQWATATPSVLEVWLGMARRWSFYFEQPVSFYFSDMFGNMNLDRFPGKVLNSAGQEAVRRRLDEWMSRQFKSNGEGSPFPLHESLDILDMTTMDIWGQMNAYSAEHFQ